VRTLANHMLSMDEPDHRRLRDIVDEAFRRRAILEMEPDLAAVRREKQRRPEGTRQHDLIQQGIVLMLPMLRGISSTLMSLGSMVLKASAQIAVRVR
jgi:cytochrome P450